MNSKTLTLVVATGLLAASFLLGNFLIRPTAISRSPTTSLTTPEALAYVNDQKTYYSELSIADSLFLDGKILPALNIYLNSIKLKESSGDLSLLCKIGTCYEYLGQYTDAISSFKSADKMRSSLAQSGTIKGVIVYLSAINGNPQLAHKIVEERILQGQNSLKIRAAHGEMLDPRKTDSMISGPGTTQNQEAKVFLGFGRNFVALFMRKEADFCYRRALKLTNQSPSIATEFAIYLRSTFHDLEASRQVFETVDPNADLSVAKIIKTELADFRAISRFKSRQPVKISKPTQSWEVERERKGHFRVFGLY